MSNESSTDKPASTSRSPSNTPCKDDNQSGSRQKCVFTLDGYQKARYEYDESQQLARYVSTVVEYIEDTLSKQDCNLLAVTAFGYADSLKLNGKALRWLDVPASCRMQESCRQARAGDFLTNDDLACVRECLVKKSIYSRLEEHVEIVSKDWKSRHKYYTEPSEQGERFRKVEIILERGGRCQND